MTTNFARFAEYFDQTASYGDYVAASAEAHALHLDVSEYMSLRDQAAEMDLTVTELLALEPEDMPWVVTN